MRAFYTDRDGRSADLCLFYDWQHTRLKVYDDRKEPGHRVIHNQVYPSWDDAITALRHMLPRCVNELTHQPIC